MFIILGEGKAWRRRRGRRRRFGDNKGDGHESDGESKIYCTTRKVNDRKVLGGIFRK